MEEKRAEVLFSAEGIGHLEKQVNELLENSWRWRLVSCYCVFDNTFSKPIHYAWLEYDPS